MRGALKLLGFMNEGNGKLDFCKKSSKKLIILQKLSLTVMKIKIVNKLDHYRSFSIVV